MVEGERELLVPGWLEGTWSFLRGGGDMVSIDRFVFLDGGEVLHVAELCWASDTGETPPTFSSVESPDARWSWESGEAICVTAVAGYAVSALTVDDGEWLEIRPDPLDCRRLTIRMHIETGHELDYGALEYADLCFVGEPCSPGYVYDCSETPAGCPGD